MVHKVFGGMVHKAPILLLALIPVVLRSSRPLLNLTGLNTRLYRTTQLTQRYRHRYRNLNLESVLIASLVKNLNLNPKLNRIGSLVLALNTHTLQVLVSEALVLVSVLVVGLGSNSRGSARWRMSV
ncbi:hypothetical protein DEU56DRAFT_346626 [Suillus clintonianus]|uniref:uncharacterized protein n=1 Tax=Suillus clintonianus TaxID=1904413 RepID=UPI001B875FA1|nr:uncharacterized protein DEU56DRAFT_346626 [Suillus clintonianus]KAG2137987.1 hypothetical protein DEU56DRAFT_346626 [Suillus clintonianus]